MSEIPPELEPIIAKTIAEMSAIISKPKMVDKHLAKPPFRFIHDIVTELTAVTGFAAGLFEGIELDGKALKEKPEKLAYLDKLLKYTESVLGEAIPVKTAKVVAGAEPDATNVFIQALGRAALLVKSGKGGSAAPAPAAAVDDGSAAREAAAKEASAKEASAKEAAAKEASAKEAAAKEADRKRKAAQEDEERRRQEDAAAESRAKAESGRKLAAAAPSASSGTLESLRVDGTYDRTRELLEPIISKPKLLDKHLAKPPMRFLHDIFTAVTEATGFAKGLFTEAELDPNNLKEKPAKVAYLDKMINLVGITLGLYCPAKSSKIVAGLEPETTNQLLQMVGLAIAKGDSSAAVARVLAGEEQQEEGGGPAASAPAPGRDDDDRQRQLQQQQEDDEREALRQAAAKREAEEARARSERDRERELAAAQERQKHEAEKAAREAAAAEEARAAAEAKDKAQAQDSASPTSGGMSMPVPIARSSRPQSATKRPPKVKDNAVAAPMPVMPDAVAVGVMKEGAADSDEEEAATDKPAPKVGGASRSVAGAGKHTRDILSEEKKAEAKEAPKETAGSGIKMGRINKGKADVGAFSEIDLEKLREGIQKVCRSTDPLGRSMEYVSEDLAVMKKELDQWRDEYAKRNDAMVAELKETEDALRPLKSELQAVEEKIREYQASINAVKSATLRNDVRIQELLKLVVTK